MTRYSSAHPAGGVSVQNLPSSLLSSPALQQVAARAAHRMHGTMPPERRKLPLRVGTRASPLALVQTRNFLTRLTRFCPLLRDLGAFQEHQMTTVADRNLKDRLSTIGGKGLFSREIHDVLVEGKIDFAVHSLKDLETRLPEGLVLACTLKREDARDALILRHRQVEIDPDHPFDCLPEGALIGCASVRRQAQMLHVRPDLRFCLLRGNVQTRLDKLNGGACDATLLAVAGLRRLGMEDRIDVALEPTVMLPAAGQGIVGVTVRESDHELRELLSAIEDPEARAVATAERALQEALDGSCRTPIGGYARLHGQTLYLDGLIASEDGTFMLRRHIHGPMTEAARMGHELAAELRRDTPEHIFADIMAS
ncbi:hydroxymethylbilane synthase [Oecophyllibacter saccharovorans]|uniref:hydroxymethylbilane synthase n=1 Tax=Oecophyllibacter saccharovorans TaxID=2558360 RepID=UPI001144322B|nr:hydroxymethylbilane synthase [Oecophyllibacter saccharovorans]QDH15705.1 hydroxymethylbilane synthase [Oecophyllibacter saccharovorans]TPW36725.1 hydroxymethylbilane synthase [Oecophyllibacter saccharovorans]